MAKGKRSKGRNYVSKGERPSVSKSTLNDMARSVTVAENYVRKVNAWKAGKRVMLTIPNPNANETAKPFIRVEARKVWGEPNVKPKESRKSAGPVPGSQRNPKAETGHSFTEA